MKTFNRISATAFLAAASLTCSPSAWSLGLGDVTVESFLNQPLQARIDLISGESDDLASVTARLASADDYELIGASREAVGVPISFTIEDIDGDAYLTASSNLPIGNPVLRLIVEVNWASGRMLREYTLFLDPPAVPSAAPAPRIHESRPAAPVTAPASPPPVPAKETAPVSKPAPQIPASRPAPTAGEYGPVASGETLWGIARDWSRDSGLNINKVMIAIQQQNPDAFLKNNINLLKRGAILRMPNVEEVNQISAAVAYNEVETQEEEVFGNRSSQSIASPAMPLLAEESAAPAVEIEQPAVVADAVDETEEAESLAVETEAAVEEVVDEAVEEVVEETTEATAETADELAEADSAAELPDQLELVPPSEASELDSAYGFEESEESGSAVDGSQTLRENLARTEEELFTQQQQNEYLEQRIKELEAQVEDNQAGNVADTDMANMEQRLREEQQSQSRAAAEEQPWYSKFSFWLIGLLIVAAGLIGWVVSRRSGAAAAALAEEEAISDMKQEAEEVLRVLDDSAEPEAIEEVAEEAVEELVEEESPAVEEDKKAATQFGDADDDAEVLDEESSDPEIQLDLARAYISMGDREAARVILEEVATNGSEEQQAEAKSMMDVLQTRP